MLNITDATKAAKKTKIGGIAHIGEYCVVKYARDNYWIYRAGALFSTQGQAGNGTLDNCVARVFEMSGADALRVIIDNNLATTRGGTHRQQEQPDDILRYPLAQRRYLAPHRPAARAAGAGRKGHDRAHGLSGAARAARCAAANHLRGAAHTAPKETRQ